MHVETILKPLYANLKRLSIGDYLYSKDFYLFTVENNIDNLWKACKDDVNKKKSVVILGGYHSTEDEEEAFLYMMSAWYKQLPQSFGSFITTVLVNFAHWHPIRLDYSSVYSNLRDLGLSEDELLKFTSETGRIWDKKPDKLEEEHIETDDTPKLYPTSNDIFVVHGHNEEMKLAVARSIDKLGLNPIILHEQPNKGRTIIEKFTDYSDVGFAVVLLSADDLAYSKKEQPERAKFRARQNVVLELGYFIGKLGRDKVLALHEITDNFDIPSDFSGVLFVPFDQNGRWQFELVKELKASGFQVDANKIL